MSIETLGTQGHALQRSAMFAPVVLKSGFRFAPLERGEMF